MFDESGEAIDIAAEPGTVGQHTVEPSDASSDDLDDHSDKNHGEKRARPDDIGHPAAKEKIAERHGNSHKGDVYPYLGLGERCARRLADGRGDTLARQW